MDAMNDLNDFDNTNLRNGIDKIEKTMNLYTLVHFLPSPISYSHFLTDF